MDGRIRGRCEFVSEIVSFSWMRDILVPGQMLIGCS
jgi:hypothetical protein